MGERCVHPNECQGKYLQMTCRSDFVVCIRVHIVMSTTIEHHVVFMHGTTNEMRSIFCSYVRHSPSLVLICTHSNDYHS